MQRYLLWRESVLQGGVTAINAETIIFAAHWGISSAG
jgi:hypothetical protein